MVRGGMVGSRGSATRIAWCGSRSGYVPGAVDQATRVSVRRPGERRDLLAGRRDRGAPRAAQGRGIQRGAVVDEQFVAGRGPGDAEGGRGRAPAAEALRGTRGHVDDPHGVAPQVGQPAPVGREGGAVRGGQGPADGPPAAQIDDLQPRPRAAPPGHADGGGDGGDARVRGEGDGRRRLVEVVARRGLGDAGEHPPRGGVAEDDAPAAVLTSPTCAMMHRSVHYCAVINTRLLR